jgi:multidrug efflux system outer membrane protein
MRQQTIPLLLGLALLLVSGCAVGPDYARPKVNSPERFRSGPPPESASLASLHWWEIFKDEKLQQLVRDALANNLDLRIAVTRMEQARQLSVQAGSQFLPQINYNGAYGRGQNTLLGNVSPNNGQTKSSGVFDLSVFWEIDIWGRIRRLNESAMADFFATEEARRGVYVSLISGVAQAYFELLELDLELEIAKRNTKTFEDTLRIFAVRLEFGTASKLETASAEGALATVAAYVPDLERQITIKENQINVLLGRNPGPVERSATLLEQKMPPEIPSGVPSALLERRPDIRQAEQQLRSANAQIGVAIADFFPKIGLTTLLGRVSSDLNLITAGAQTSAWGFFGSLTGPLFHGGALTAKYRQSKAAWEEAALTYEKTCLNAFQEVSNALISREKLDGVREQQARAVKAYVEAVDVSLKRYTAGKASYYEVLQNQQQVYPAERSLAQTQLNQILTVVQLYKALGGGWSEAELKADEKKNCPLLVFGLP